MPAGQFSDGMTFVLGQPGRHNALPNVEAILGRADHIRQAMDAPSRGLVLVVVKMSHKL